MIDFTVSGLDELIAALEALPVKIDDGMHAYLLQRAESGVARFQGCTPVDTDKARPGWAVDERGILEVAIVNPVTSTRGFPYPSALLTGTGMRGAGATPASGYSGGFSGAWPGMLPAAALQDAWNSEANESLATPELLAEIHA